MTEIVTAVFETPTTAEAAIQDLKVARIPSAVVQRGELREDSNAVWHRNANTWQRPMVTVAVDDMHADAVTGILRQFESRRAWCPEPWPLTRSLSGDPICMLRRVTRATSLGEASHLAIAQTVPCTMSSGTLMQSRVSLRGS